MLKTKLKLYNEGEIIHYHYVKAHIASHNHSQVQFPVQRRTMENLKYLFLFYTA